MKVGCFWESISCQCVNLHGKLKRVLLQRSENQDLGGDDAEEHREGVDGGVADGGDVVGGVACDERQGDGIGHAAGQRAHQRKIIELEHQPPQDAHHQDGNDRHQETIPDPNQAAAGERADEGTASLRTEREFGRQGWRSNIK